MDVIPQMQSVMSMQSVMALWLSEARGPQGAIIWGMALEGMQ